ncbi:TPA: DUF6379 domain-containing protein [Streptococcus suis]
MAFAMRMPLNREIIKKDSYKEEYINGKNQGFSFAVQLAYYRGHYLSDIDKLAVTVDGEEIPQEAVTFELNGKELPIYKVKEAYTEFWNQTDLATIHVIKAGGLAPGQHQVKLDLLLRIPYMEIGPNHAFMPLDSGDSVVFEVEV